MLNTVIWYHSYVLERNISSGTVDISEINALYFILNKMLSVSEIFVFVLNVSVQKMSTNIYPPRVLHFHFSKMRIVMQLPWGHPTAGRAEIHQDIQNIICTALVRLINFFFFSVHDIFYGAFLCAVFSPLLELNTTILLNAAIQRPACVDAVMICNKSQYQSSRL